MLVGILLYGIYDVEAALALYEKCGATLSEGNAVHHVARLAVNKFQLDVLLHPSHHLARSVVIDIVSAEERFRVTGTMRSKLFYVGEHLLCDIFKVNFLLNVENCLRLLWQYVLIDIFLEALPESRYVLDFHGETCGIGVSSKILQEVAAALYGIVNVGGGYSPNSNYYLYNGKYYWTLSPSYFFSYSSNAFVWFVLPSGSLNPGINVTNSLGVRPVINLKADTLITKGDGSSLNPFVVS